MKLRIVSLVVVSVLAYMDIIGHDFLYEWDDQWVVINEYTDAGLTAGNIWHVLTEFYSGQYAPFNEIPYLFLHELFGYSPAAFHTMSILWHTANVVLLFFFVKELLFLMFPESVKRRNENVAFLAALLWAVHPVTVESVAWVSASKILVYTFFYLLALLLYLKYISKPTLLVYLGLLALFTASFFGKEQAVVLPLAFLLIDYAVKRGDGLRYLCLEKLPFLILAVFFGIVTIVSQGSSCGVPEYGFHQRIFFACYTLYEYLVKAVIPLKLSYLYPFPCNPGGAMPWRMFFYPLVMLAFGYAVFALRRHRIFVFGLLFFVIHLLVAVHLISTARFAIVADRYNYLALTGPLLIIAYYTMKLMQRHRKMTIAFLGLYFVYFFSYTIVYQRQWKDSKTLKAHWTELMDKGDGNKKI